MHVHGDLAPPLTQLPSRATMGDFLRPSVFVQATRAERAAAASEDLEDDLCEALNIEVPERKFVPKVEDIVADKTPRKKSVSWSASACAAACALPVARGEVQLINLGEETMQVLTISTTIVTAPGCSAAGAWPSAIKAANKPSASILVSVNFI